MKQPVTIFWFRRDLRLNDNVGLYEALRGDHTVLPIFIFTAHQINTKTKQCFIFRNNLNKAMKTERKE